MLRLAGCSSGCGVSARGGCSAGRGGALAAFRGRCAFRGSVRNAGPVLPHGEAVARRHFALRSSVYRRLGGVARSYRNVARSSQACRAFPSECRAFISSLSCVSIGMSHVHLKPVARSYCGVLRSITPAVCRLAPNRTACGILRSCSAGSRSPFVRSRDVGAVICLCGFTSGLAVSLWRSRRGCQRTRGTRGTENGAGGAAFVPLCVVILVLKFFPRGVRWGLRAPKPAPKSLRLSGLSSFNSRRGCVKHSRGQRVIQAAASLFRFASRFLCRTTIESGIRSGACGSGRLMMKYLSSSMA